MKNLIHAPKINHIAKATGLLAIGIIGILMVLLFYSPFYTLQKFNNTYTDSLQFASDQKELINNAKFFELKKHEAYLKSKLIVAKNDSISLSVNLPDSTISIEVQGVILHQSGLTSISNSLFFERASHMALFNYFQSPFKTKRSISNIEKEPVIYVQAPKDTAEAARNIFVADTTLAKRIYIRLELEKDLTVVLTDNQRKWSSRYFYYIFSSRILRLNSALNDIFHFKVPYYTPVIKIELNRNDLISIYRALPHNAVVTIHM